MTNECSFCSPGKDGKDEEGCPHEVRRRKNDELFGPDNSRDPKLAIDEACAPDNMVLAPHQVFLQAVWLCDLGRDVGLTADTRQYALDPSFLLGLRKRVAENNTVFVVQRYATA